MVTAGHPVLGKSMSSSNVHFITALIYVLALGFAWTATGRLQTKPGEFPASADGFASLVPVRIALGAGLVTHAFVLAIDLFGGEGLNIGFSHAVSLIVWLSLAAYYLIGFDNRLMQVAAMYLAPLAIIAVLLPLVVPAQRIVHYGGFAFKAHFVAAILAYSLFTVAAIHALLMWSLERRLHTGELPANLTGMPSLLRLEKLLFQLLITAFVLLTATVASGVVFSEALFGKPFQLTHKTVFGLLSWGIFGGLLWGHWQFGKIGDSLDARGLRAFDAFLRRQQVRARNRFAENMMAAGSFAHSDDR
jgi:ABC-type uncharacterized transport system permease subunit